jgi:hypothetical protein
MSQTKTSRKYLRGLKVIISIILLESLIIIFLLKNNIISYGLDLANPFMNIVIWINIIFMILLLIYSKYKSVPPLLIIIFFLYFGFLGIYYIFELNHNYGN